MIQNDTTPKIKYVAKRDVQQVIILAESLGSILSRVAESASDQAARELLQVFGATFSDRTRRKIATIDDVLRKPEDNEFRNRMDCLTGDAVGALECCAEGFEMVASCLRAHDKAQAESFLLAAAKYIATDFANFADVERESISNQRKTFNFT